MVERMLFCRVAVVSEELRLRVECVASNWLEGMKISGSML